MVDINHIWKFPSQQHLLDQTSERHSAAKLYRIELTNLAGMDFLPSRTSTGQEESSFPREHTRC